jgi:hypothetical protein
MHPSRRYRGSARRVRHLGWRKHTPPNLWILVAATFGVVAIVLLLLHAQVSR